MFNTVSLEVITSLWNSQHDHFQHLPVVCLTSPIIEKTKDYDLICFNFHSSPFKISPPSLTFIVLLTVHLLFKAYLFIPPAIPPSSGHCSITFTCILNIFLSIRFFPSTCKHEFTSNIKKERKPWLVWLSGLSTGLRTKGSLVGFPVRAHAWVVGQVPSRGCTRGNHTRMFSPYLSPSFLSL